MPSIAGRYEMAAFGAEYVRLSRLGLPYVVEDAESDARVADLRQAYRDTGIRVADNGIGIPAELQPRIFDLFTQAQRSPDRAQGGLGIGLALVKSLVDLHGGSVGCSSAGTGQGSEFSVCLPRAARAHPERAPGLASDAEPAARRRILVVDDNVDAAQMLAMYLEVAGHEVLVEHDSWAALARAKSAVPAVCVLDIGLPGMDGNELAQRLRADPGTAGALLIAATGYGQEQDRRRALAAGFDHHFVKPVALQAGANAATRRLWQPKTHLFLGKCSHCGALAALHRIRFCLPKFTFVSG